MRNLRFIGRALFAVAIALVLVPMVGAEAGGGTLLAYSVLTNSEVDKIWRKSQGKLQKGFNFVTKEFKWVSEFPDLEIDTSLREMTYPVDIYEDRGITSLPEGGREAEPMSQNAVDATISLIHLNGRFTVAKLARWANAADGGRGAITNQMKFQGRKKVEAMGRRIGDMFYGYSNGYLAQVDDAGGALGAAASHTIPIKNGYGDSSITDGTFITDKIKVGDQVALVRAGSLVSNGIGEVTAVTEGTPSIDVTWIPGNADPNDDDYIVFANGASPTTIEHTDYNRALVGLLDFLKSTSVHGISSATVPDWDVAYSDTTAGRFTGQKFRKANDEIENYGMEDPNIITLMAQGVGRDVTAQYQAGVRYSSPMGMEIDGDFTAGGNRPRSTRRVPPGMVVQFAKGAIKKKTIYDETNPPKWSGAKELIDDSGWVFAIDWSGLLCTSNRKMFAYHENQTEI